MIIVFQILSSSTNVVPTVIIMPARGHIIFTTNSTKVITTESNSSKVDFANCFHMLFIPELAYNAGMSNTKECVRISSLN